MIPYYRPSYNASEFRAMLELGVGREDFEAAMAAYMGARYGVAFAYGRAGFLAVLEVLGLKQAEIILPAYGCIAMANMIVATGNVPVFVDIDLADYNIDPRALAQAMTSKTRMVVITHTYGYPMDVEQTRAIVGDRGLVLFEDCAQSLFTFPPGRSELHAEAALFSFGPGKPMFTAFGGMIVTNSADLYARLKDYRDQEMNKFSIKAWGRRWLWALGSYVVFSRLAYSLRRWIKRHSKPRPRAEVPQAEHVPTTLPHQLFFAYNDFQARLGLAQLDKVEKFVNERRKLAEFYDRELQDVPGIYPAPLVDGAMYSFYTMRVPRRDALKFKMRMAERSIAVDQSYDYVLPTLAPYRRFAQGRYPHAVQAAQEVVNLPLYPGLQLKDVKRVVAAVRSSLDASMYG